MSITVQTIKPPQEEEEGKEHRPTITKWKGEPMIRVHSIKSTVKEILQIAQALDVVKIGIIGEPSTGKTSLALLLAHFIHKMSDIPFAFRIFGEHEFLNMEQTLRLLEPANYILYFHDLSFLTDKKKLEQVKAAITKIRHLKSDVKIILIYDYHYTLGLDKYLRQSNLKYFTSMGSSELENMIKLVGTKYTGRIQDFAKKYSEMTTRHKCTFQIGKNKYFTYNYKNPFVVCQFWNGARLRYVIFPKREWVDKVCSKCSSANGQLLQSAVPIDQFKKESEQKFGPHIFEAAVKLQAFSNGMNVYASSVVSAQRYLTRALETKLISLEELLTSYGLEITKTKLRKKLDGVLAQ